MALRDDRWPDGAFQEMRRADIGVRNQVDQRAFSRLHRTDHQHDERAVLIFLGAVHGLGELGRNSWAVTNLWLVFIRYPRHLPTCYFAFVEQQIVFRGHHNIGFISWFVALKHAHIVNFISHGHAAVVNHPTIIPSEGEVEQDILRSMKWVAAITYRPIHCI